MNELSCEHVWLVGGGLQLSDCNPTAQTVVWGVFVTLYAYAGAPAMLAHRLKFVFAVCARIDWPNPRDIIDATA